MKREIRTIQLPTIKLSKETGSSEENKSSQQQEDLTIQEENVFGQIYNLESEQETHLTPR